MLPANQPSTDYNLKVNPEKFQSLEDARCFLLKQVKEWEDWKASSEERHAKGKSNLTKNLKNKNTLRFNTTRKPKK